ncbi:MAG: NHLP bacteriocin system secretion protein [Candidatus Hydrogenedentota bacterium]|nr:MAG: NHLP bacteriocin system secretion protein [Candidatus Hydrogenedentota bacterium]
MVEYRKAALDKLASPEQLDRLITVTGSRSWLALGSICFLLLLILVWSVVGRIPVTVSGRGILIREGGLVEIESLGTGLISELLVEEGDHVEPGQLVARIRQPTLVTEIEQARDRVQELEVQRERTSKLESERVRLGAAALDQQEAELRGTIRTSRERVAWLEKRVEAYRDAVREGLITEEELRRVMKERASEREVIARAESRLKKIASDRQALETERERNLLAIDKQLSDARRTLAALESRLREEGQVFSPHRGRVVEIKVEQGAIVTRNAALMSLEAETGPLVAEVFIPVEAKKIRRGMAARIAPATVKKEEYGMIVGRVDGVSALPATREGMMHLLKNELLVKELASRGAPFRVTLSLEEDSASFSGFRWTSSRGPRVRIESGMLCEGRIVVEKKAPIRFLIPALKSFFGIT